MNSKHTPTPWVATNYSGEIPNIESADGKSVATTNQQAQGAEDIARRHADAHFIVRAVNAHDDLVAILAGIDATADSQLAEHVMRSRKRIRAALTKAEGA